LKMPQNNAAQFT